MYIKRDRYLNQLISRKENGLIRVITGMRRCGKSYLLFNIFYDYLISQGVKAEQIIDIALDDDTNAVYRDPAELSQYIRSKITDKQTMYYIMIDEVQYAITKQELKTPGAIKLYDVLNGLLRLRNVDIYVTGSNSKMLSKDVMTEFRGRGDAVEVYPLTFKEYYEFVGGDKSEAYEEYALYGGMPLLSTRRQMMKNTCTFLICLPRCILKILLKDIRLKCRMFLENLQMIYVRPLVRLQMPQRLPILYRL